jgi:O-antigen/teichoic acid export membrane protein
LILAPVALAVMASASRVLGYDVPFLVLLLVVTLAALSTSIASALQDTLRAFERVDLSAKAIVASQALAAVVLLPVLLSGGSVLAFVLAQATCTLFGSVLLFSALRKLGIRVFRVRLDSVRRLAVQGLPFLVFGLVLELQPSVDAFFLSSLAPADVVGWNAVARKLVGVLVYPATALVGALYPTLCRLQSQDPGHFGATVSGALRLAMLIGMSAGLGCIFYPELGVAAFGSQDYARSCENLRVLGLFIVLVYISMPISSALMALGRQRTWTAVQCVCIILSAVLDPYLVPWFQTNHGNGGLGVCVASVISELAMVATGCALLPKGTLQAWLGRTVMAVGTAGLCMALIARATSDWSPWLAAPCALLCFAVVAWLSGEIRKTQIFVRSR